MTDTIAVQRRLGLAQLSLLETSPPELVEVAAAAGFDFIGVRVRPVTATETPFDLQPGSPLLARTLERMAATGVGVVDIEFLLLEGRVGREAWLPMFEAGAALGAQYVTVAGADPDRHRLGDTLAQMTADGAAFGITPALEPISYQAVRSLPAADELARQAGCAVLLDALHYTRFGGNVGQVHAAAGRIPMLQLCDGPAAPPPDRDALVHESRSDRWIPGQGAFPLVDLVRTLDPGLPISVEVAADTLRGRLGPLEFARTLHAAARQVLQAAAAGSTDSPAGLDLRKAKHA